MSQVQLNNTGRVRKVLPKDPVLTETVPAGLTTYLQTDDTRMQKIEKQSYDKELEQAIRKSIKIKIRRNGYTQTFAAHYGCPPESSDYALLQELDQLDEEEEWGQRLSGQQTVGLWCTLSPEPGITSPHELLETMEKIAKKKGVAIMTYSIENYGVISEHPHAHFLILLDKSQQSGERNKMKATITRICKPFKTKTERYLDITAVSKKSYDKKLAYVKGKKIDSDKAEKVLEDIEWRKEHGLKDWYIYPPMPKHDQD